MARKTVKSLSRANKRRVLLAQQRRLEKQLSQVSQKLEACIACDTRALRIELASIESGAESERQAMYKRLGLSPEQAADLLSSRKAAGGKKAAKKKASKRSSAKKTTSKKTAKKAGSKKRSGKKRSKKG